MKKLLSILLSFAIIVGSIGFHVIEHHCIWCGGDKVEFVTIGLPDHHTGSCCDDQPGTSAHDCHDDGCCDPEFLTLETGLMDEGGLDLLKTVFNVTDYTPPVVAYAFHPDMFYPVENKLIIPLITGCPASLHSGIVALRC